MKTENKVLFDSPIIGYAYHRIILDDNGKPVDYEFLEVNGTFEKLTGQKAIDLVGRTVTAAIPGSERTEFNWIGVYGEVALNGGESEFEQYSEPLEKWYRVHVYSTEKLFFTTIFIDITTSKKQTEELEAFFSVNLDLLCIADLEGNFIKTNEAWSRILGYSTEELNKRKFLEFVHPDDMEATLGAMADLGKGKDALEFTNRYKSKDGSYRFIEWRSHPSGDLIYAAARDVTERVMAEKRIVSDKQQIDMFFNQSLHGFFLCMLDEPIEWNEGIDKKKMIEHVLDHQKMTRVNRAMLDQYGAEEKDFVGITVRELFKHNLDHAREIWTGLFDKGKWHVETYEQKLDGTPIVIEGDYICLYDDKGRITGHFGVQENITERKKAEEDIKRTSILLEAAQRIAKMGAWELDLATGKTFWTDEVYNIHEVPKDFDHNKANGIEFYHPDYRPIIAKAITDSIEKQIPFDVKCKFITAKNNLRWVRSSGYPLLEEGKVTFLIGMFRDITEEEDVKEAIIREQSFSKRLLENMADGFSVVDIEGKQIGVNNAFCEMTGFSEEELIGQTAPYPYWPSEERENIAKAFQQALAGELSSFELIFKKKSEERFPVLLSTSTLLDENGNTINYFANIKDNTERKKAEQELKATKQKLDSIFSEMDDVVWSASLPDYKMLFMTPSAVKLYGTPYEEFMDDNTLWEKAIYQDDKPVIPKIYQQLQENGHYEYTYRILSRDGKIKWVSNKGKLIHNEQGTPIRIDGIVSDVSERKKAEQTILKDSELQKILMAVSSQFINVPLDYTDEVINSALATLGQFTNTDRSYIFKYDHEKRVCSNIYEWCGDGVAAQIEQLQGIPFDAVPDWVEAHFAGKPMHIADVMALPADSRSRQVLELQGVQSILVLPMMDGDNCMGFVGFDAVKSNHIFSDNEQRLLQLFALMLVNVLNRNRLETELTTAKQRAEAASKAKSEFLANMSHEIRTPLNGVIGFTDLLKNTPLTSVQQQYVNNANVSGHTLMGIINDILDFSKIEAGMLHLEMIKTDMIELLENSVDIVKYQASQKNLELLLHIDRSMPRFAVTDPIRLKQVLANLLGNAVKFTEKGEVELKVKYEIVDKGRGKLSFFVRDTGIGITEEQMNTLFKAFSQADSSTTRKFGGTGLGLIISDLIAKELGGKILVDSTQGEGTTFSFELVTEMEDGGRLEMGPLKLVKRCLIIDDNANNCLILEDMLAGWGIDHVSCDNGLTALKLLETSKPFDVIICDYNMPYIDGLETIRMIRNKLKLTADKQPVILLHSSSDDAELHKQCDELGVRFRLTKPVKGHDLYGYLRQVHDPEKYQAQTAVSTTPKAQTALSGSVNILIAEDVKMNMMMIKALIGRLYPEAVLYEAVNGLEAVRLMSEVSPDLILMDIQMPELDGLEATKKIRAVENESGIHVPIIALTAGAFKEEEERCLAAGMDGFLTKPVEPEKIKSVLMKYCGGKENSSK
ncbi:putative sensor/response hybrid [Lunatimonas lonarensis]|uniref:histidine kinase n=1 Tax=Lunatimonas lonarensis TaxID=1232681 RepID=R7ZYV2_9BACT|nr:PAS domain S-box protein [Lunatimonas lonarensis]EON79281.1 putative sensor/response hybrid [Lunatimonas lonarensis]